VTVQRINNESFRSDIYKIDAPVFSAGLGTPEKNSNWISTVFILIVGLAISASFYLFIANRKKFRTQDKHEAREEIKEILEPGIYMVGRFRVINRNKEDISANFTPLMKQLLCILVLYSYRQKGGISNAELKETLWDDKSEESYYNNRGVNIKKLRTCLAEVGNIEICTSNGTWSLNIEDSKCDWFRYMKEIESISFESITIEQICRLVRIASHGPLLSDMRYEWTDRFKAQYTDLMIATLEKVCSDTRHQLSSDMQIHIADAILTFDSLDEAAVKSKCKALITQKRLGIAESTFKNFTQEYNRLMGEEYSVSFNEFVR
jgi:two-component SAPR family response regulator